MNREVATRVLPRAAFSLAISAGFVVGMEALLQHATYSASEQISQIEACAHHLGNQAVLSEAIPPECDQAIGQNVYSYDRGNNTYYLLPSATMMLAQKQSVPTEVRTTNESNKIMTEVAGGVMAVALFGVFTWASRDARRRKTLTSQTSNITSFPTRH